VRQASFWPHAITREANDLVLSGIFYAGTNGAVAAFSLTTKQPVYPTFFPGSSFSIVRHAEASSLVLLHSVKRGPHDDSKGGSPEEWKIETWDTRSQRRVSDFDGATDAGTVTEFRVSIPQSNLFIRAVGSRISSRRTLIVMDDRTGSVLQEIGQLPTAVGMVVSPDGSRAAVFGSKDIRIYKVNRRE
jgi:hypothetical protein